MQPLELRRLVDIEIAEAHKRRAQNLIRQKAEEERRQLEIKMKAEDIIAQIPSRCAREAEAGRSHAIVMSLAHDDYNHKKPYNKLDPKDLKNVGKIVWDVVFAAGLEPDLQHWDSGDGMKCGFNIIVHFRKGKQ